MGTPNREPQEYIRNMISIYLQGPHLPIIFLSMFGCPTSSRFKVLRYRPACFQEFCWHTSTLILFGMLLSAKIIYTGGTSNLRLLRQMHLA